jgi:hypothetical protein
VVEVEVAGAVEGFLGGAGGRAGGQDLGFVFAAAGQVEAESPDRGRSAVAEPDERQPISATDFAVDVGELAVVADVQVGELSARPACRYIPSG